MTLHSAVAGVVALVALSLAACSSNNNAANQTAAPPPAAGQPAQGASVNGIPCESSEKLTYHIHAHLAIFANGQPVPVPANIGIVGSKCIYWMHTHDASGVIHLEAPQQREFTLGDFFAIWGQPLSRSQALGFKADAASPAAATPGVQIGRSLQFFVDGQPFTGDPRTIALGAHTLVQINYGPPFPAPAPFTFPAGL